MRVTRIRLRDYRGVAEREVALLPTGITVISGPNEVGKSSLAEALDVLFDYYDSSTHSSVKAVRPVGRDVGAEIEADVECGPYRFTYAKRFHRGRQTTLAIHAPRPQKLVGREAHDRVQQILAESMDVQLWKALRVQQGRGIDQPRLDGLTSLAGALDRAAAQAPEAGVAPGGAAEREQSLFERARSEYLRWFTPTGRDGKPLTDARKSAAAAQSDVEALEAVLAEVEADVRRSEELDAAATDQREALSSARARAAAAAEALASALALADDAERLGLAAEIAAGEEREADQRRAERSALRQRLAGAELGIKDLAERAIQLAPRLEAAAAAVAELAERRRGAKAALEDARVLAERRRVEADALRDLVELAELRQRRQGTAAALEAAAAAEAALRDIAVDEAAVEEIRGLHHAVEAQSAVLAAQAPTVRVRAAADVGIEVDGVRRDLSVGETAEHAVEDGLAIVVPGVIELSIGAGAGMEALAAELRDRRAGLREACRLAAVVDLAEAEHELRRRQQAESALREARADAARQLGDEQLAALDERSARLSERVDPSAPGAGAPPDRPALDAARAALDEAAARRVDAEAALDQIETAAADAEAALRAVSDEAREHAAELRRVEAEAAEAGDALQRAREDATDEALDTALAQAAQRAAEAVAAHRLAAERAAQAQMEHAAAAEATGRAEVDALERQLRDLEDERREVNARLALRGGDGLFDQLSAARSVREFARREVDRVEAAAAAARLLHDTLRECRDAAQQAYAGPLRRQIVEFGRLVFGPTFDVELAEDLSIVTRTLDGATLAFEQLSVGAREQLSLIARISCALLVSSDGGVPLLLDDTLGYSDDDRVAAMHQVLQAAGERCQIVVLTCRPERYDAIGEAQLVAVA